MRVSSRWLFGFLAAALQVGVAAGTDPAWDVLPLCAQNCTLSVLGSGVTACAPTNTTCLCTDEIFQNSVTACVVPACTVKESLIAKRLGSRQCGVPVTQQNDVPVLTFVFALTSFLVMVRLLVKFLGHGGGWGVDDSLMLLSFSFSIGLYGVHLWRIYDLGLGKNTWEVPFANITKILLAFFANEMLYIVHISVTKISVCFFFLRIFSASRVFRLFAYPVIVMNVLIMALFIFIIVFQCKPIHLAWTGWAKEEPGTCFDIYKLVLGNGIINIAMDVIIIGLPIYETTKLQLSKHRKLGVVLMFAMGFMLTIIGIVRCIYFWRTRAMSNPTINLMPLAYWSCIETLVAIICACLPDSRFFFSSLVPKFYKSVASSYKVSTPSSYSTLSGSSKPSSRQAGKVAKDDLEKIELETDITSITVTTTKSSV